MAFVGQMFQSHMGKQSRAATRNAVMKVIKQNKDLAQAVNALEKTKGRQDAVLEIIKRNPALRLALGHELMKSQKG